MEDNELPRHNIGIDALSLMDEDLVAPSAEEIFLGDQMFQDLIRDLPSDRDRFIAMALFTGFNKTEIAHMLKVHLSNVTRPIQSVQVILIKSKPKTQ